MKLYQLLNLAKKINNDESSNKIILAHLLKKNLSWIYANLNDDIIAENVLAIYLNLVRTYVAGFPLAYILGYSFFHGNKIFVDQHVLIPRNETELLVEKTLFYAQKLFNSNRSSLDVLDLATGSGCIAVSLALFQPQWNIIASDVSSEALVVAKTNQQFHDLKNISLIASDLFSNLKPYQFDLIICNPPYIDQNDSVSYNRNSLQHEPALALFAKNFGLEYYQKILKSCLNFTKSNFLVALEIGFNQKQDLEKILKQDFCDYYYWFEKDYQKHWRFLFISSKAL